MHRREIDRTEHLRSQAARCRRLAAAVLDTALADRLEQLGRSYDADADRLCGPHMGQNGQQA